ncbi:MAG: hypothetical protein WCG55_04640 [bacterium]
MKHPSRKIIILILGISALIGLCVYGYVHFFVGGSASNMSSTSGVSGDVADLVSLSITPGATITDVATITGEIKGVYFFEGKAQGVLLDENKKILNSFSLDATSNWLTADAVSFTATVDTTSALAGPGYIRLKNDNPSGDPEKDKYIDVPIVIQ